jgi:hypothetical protein
MGLNKNTFEEIVEKVVDDPNSFAVIGSVKDNLHVKAKSLIVRLCSSSQSPSDENTNHVGGISRSSSAASFDLEA